MSDRAALLPVDLDRLPPETFRQVVVYLDDVLRECQLVLVAEAQGQPTDPALSEVAKGLVPVIEEIGDAFEAADVRSDGAGSLRLTGSLTVGQAATIADLQVQLVHLRTLGRRGDLLLDSDPEIAALLTWIWEEISDQLHGRAPRPYRSVG